MIYFGQTGVFILAKKVKAVSIGSQLNFLVDAIRTNNKSAAKLLISQVLHVARVSDLNLMDEDAILGIIEGFKPTDIPELMHACQATLAHLFAIHSLSENYINSKGQGALFMKISHNVLTSLNQYRSNKISLINTDEKNIINPDYKAQTPCRSV